ncbi:uncharacterized protein MYCFIDRAFT_175019 [Pseudocercospora fijiensis CIRAD86]|uniref:Uncharacterized protein n=1 Tax=Pseudocercospora fijiensis (strain CIRAD86) TaxID=383855 RepID=M2Z181_PSEFD|nr:uncharacterized protein MYCFIDRAFT_175019 [Pseudocercospora fijiensis CIRAD86]EME83595.1 hypothetical protein MYCFIDRAFT_175019 [Pseudocercospora fijiensis CIRAD86]
MRANPSKTEYVPNRKPFGSASITVACASTGMLVTMATARPLLAALRWRCWHVLFLVIDRPLQGSTMSAENALQGQRRTTMQACESDFAQHHDVGRVTRPIPPMPRRACVGPSEDQSISHVTLLKTSTTDGMNAPGPRFTNKQNPRSHSSKTLTSLPQSRPIPESDKGFTETFNTSRTLHSQAKSEQSTMLDHHIMHPETTEQVLLRLGVIKPEAKRNPVTTRSDSGGTLSPFWIDNPVFAITATRLKRCEPQSDIKPPIASTNSIHVQNLAELPPTMHPTFSACYREDQPTLVRRNGPVRSTLVAAAGIGVCFLSRVDRKKESMILGPPRNSYMSSCRYLPAATQLTTEVPFDHGTLPLIFSSKEFLREYIHNGWPRVSVASALSCMVDLPTVRKLCGYAVHPARRHVMKRRFMAVIKRNYSQNNVRHDRCDVKAQICDGECIPVAPLVVAGDGSRQVQGVMYTYIGQQGSLHERLAPFTACCCPKYVVALAENVPAEDEALSETLRAYSIFTTCAERTSVTKRCFGDPYHQRIFVTPDNLIICTGIICFRTAGVERTTETLKSLLGLFIISPTNVSSSESGPRYEHVVR